MYRLLLPSSHRVPKSAASQSTITNQTSSTLEGCLPARAPPATVAGHAQAADVVDAGWAPLFITVSLLFGTRQALVDVLSLLLLISWTLSIPEHLVSADKQQH